MEQKLVIKTSHEESFSGRAAFWTATTLHALGLTSGQTAEG